MVVTTARPSFFGRAFAAATRAPSRWQLLLALYVPSLLFGLISALAAYSAGQALAGFGQWTDKLVDGNLASVIVELSLATAGNAESGGQSMSRDLGSALAGFGVAALVILAGVAAQGVVYNILAGGVLERLKGDTSRSFWRACLHWAGPMLLFAIVGTLLMLLLGGVGLSAIWLVPSGSALGLLAKPLLAGLWLGCLNGLFELARADMVLRGDRRPLPAIGRALGLLGRPTLFLQVLVLWLLLAVVGIVYWGATGAGVGAVPVDRPTLGLIVSQVFALGGALIKLIRLAMALAMASVAQAAPEKV